MTTHPSTPAVNLSDHAAAAAYLMNHADATDLVVLDGHWPGWPATLLARSDSVGTGSENRQNHSSERSRGSAHPAPNASLPTRLHWAAGVEPRVRSG